MAIHRNLDLRIEALNSSMSELEAAKSHGMYNPVLSLNGTGGVVATTGDPFFTSRSGTATLAITQSLPIGGSIAISTQSGYTNADVEGTISSSTVWQSTAGLTLTLPLLKNAGMETTQLNITLASNALQDSIERFRFVTSDAVLSVVTTYNHLYVLREILAVRQSALTSAQKLLEEVNKKAASAPSRGMETANAEYAIVQRRKDMVDASRNVKDQEASLRYLIGLEQETPIITIDSPSRTEPRETEDQALKDAVTSRIDLKQLQLALKTSELQERVARRQTLPDLSLTASGGFTGTGGNFSDSYRQLADRPGDYWSGGLQFTMPLGNTVAENDYLKSRIRTEQVKSQIRALTWKIHNDVKADLRALISSRLQVQMADRALQLAEKRTEEYRKNNIAGTATIQDVINAENDLTYAHSAQLDALETFSNTVAKLWRDEGVLLDRLNIRIDTSSPAKVTEGAK